MRSLLAVALVVLLSSAPAAAEDARVAFFSKQLKSAKDPRARVQAARALGIYGDPAAVSPLCDALWDEHEDVRVAAAKGLDQIGEISAIGCLEVARDSDRDAGVQSSDAIGAALESLNALKEMKPRLYVMLVPVENRAELTNSELTLLTDRMKQQLSRYGALFAPEGEGRAAAARVLQRKQLEGFTLAPTVEKYGEGLSLSVVVLSYPDKIVKGQLAARAGGTAKTADLIRALAPTVMANIADEFEWTREKAAVSEQSASTEPSAPPEMGAPRTSPEEADSRVRWLLLAAGLIAIAWAVKALRSRRRRTRDVS